MARVTARFTWAITPGKELEFIEISSRGKKIHMRHGAENANLGRVNIGGNTNQWDYVLTFASGEAFGKFTDTLATDNEWLALWAEGVEKQIGTPTGSRMVTWIQI